MVLGQVRGLAVTLYWQGVGAFARSTDGKAHSSSGAVGGLLREESIMEDPALYRKLWGFSPVPRNGLKRASKKSVC